MYDVVVIGGGPIGSYTAGKLATLGYNTVVIEEHSRSGEAVCCTGIIGKECVDRFPVDKGVILNESRSAKFFAPSGRFLHMEKPSTQAYIVDRPAFDASMAVEARKQGAEYKYNTRVRNITIRSDVATVEIETSSKNIETRSIIIACGFHSHLCRRIGLGKLDYFAAGAQADVDTEVDEVEVHFGRTRAPKFFSWLVPTSPGRGLVGLLSYHKPSPILREFLSYLHDQGKIGTPNVNIRYGGVPLKPLSRTYRERILVVGDAAGQVKPTTGGGIYYGLLSASKAVETMDTALTLNNFSTNILSQYERAWKASLTRELKLDRWARWIFERLSDRRMERVFEVVESRDIHHSLMEIPDFSFDWHRGLIMKGVKQAGPIGLIQLLRP
ncbi:MAG: NAD(P)/FAD-dependent oxidoreductase [Chloroflexota bacterium]|nr:NAD(P)/FAD-dependent oxidoreductase [Chloroflexota bacterium]